MAHFTITTDLAKIDMIVVYDFLSRRSSWAQGRSFETVQRSMENSICFGAIDSCEKLLGFGRVISDKAVFAWILDVFVLEEERNRGIGTAIVTAILEHPELQNLQRWGLITGDKQKFYEKFGFLPLKNADFFMEMGYKRHKKKFYKISL